MNGLIPSFISKQYDQERFEGDLQATAMFIDISGFSAMTQTLMRNGKEGAEVLAEVINRVFTPAIRIIYESGGFVSSFAGDAFTSIFPSESVAAVDAMNAATRLRELFRNDRIGKTKFGSFGLSVRISLSHGRVSWGIIIHENQNVFHFGGDAIRRCSENGNHTSSGEIVFDDEVLSRIDDPSRITFSGLEVGLHQLVSVPSAPAGCIDGLPVAKHQEKFIPGEVLSLNRRGEFRDIVSCYMKFDEISDFESGVSRVISLAHVFGGYFNKIDFSDHGGVMLVLFGAPLNPGNLYNRALDFALAAGKIPGLSIRAGLACGTAFAGFVGSDLRSEYTALGTVVNLSARLTEIEEKDVILLDSPLFRQCSSHYDMLELKPREFKGFEGKIPVYRLAGKKRNIQVSSFSEHMIGRERELHQLSESIQPVISGRFGGIVYVYGNPGVGKSRLVYELTSRLRIKALMFQTDSILRKPLNPFAYFFKKYFDQDEEISLEERKKSFDTIYQELIGRIVNLSDMETRLETIQELSRIKSALGSVIGLSWEGSAFDTIESRDRTVVTRLAISEFFKAMSLIEPLILVIEDIHWLDDESRGVLEVMTRQAGNYPFIILATSRFSDDGSRPVLKLDDDVPCSEITLGDLSNSNTRLLIEDRLSGKADTDLFEYIQARTEGNPFYTEQFCLYLRENDLISNREGLFTLNSEPSDIPTDINMILIARIDRLSENLKETVQVASVLGREFEVQVLSTLINFLNGVRTDSSIGSVAQEILDLIICIEEEGIWSALTELKYIFNHSLLRDAAYDMQLRTRLRDLHRLAGDAIGSLHPDDRTFYADSAHHYEMAEDWDKAREYCARAGDYFYESLKYDEALIYRGKALSICRRSLGEKHLETAQSYFDTGVVNSDKGDYDAALECHRKALETRLELLGEKHPDTARSYSNIGEVHLERGEYHPALENHHRAIAIRREVLGEKHPDTATSYNDIGSVYLDTNEYDKALEFYQRALSIEMDVLGEMHPSTACSYNNIGHVHSRMGDFDSALEYYEKALAIQRETLSEKHPHTATLFSNIASLYWKKHDYETALEYSEKAHSMQKELLGEKHPSTARSYNNIGVIHSRMGHGEISLAYYKKALEIRKELLGEKHPDTVNSYNNIGMAHRQNGDIEKAQQFLEKALSLGRELYGDRHPSTALSLGSIAIIYAAQEKYEEAEEYFEQTHSILRDALGEKHPNTIRTLMNMADMYEKMGDDAKTDNIRRQLEDLNGQ